MVKKWFYPAFFCYDVRIEHENWEFEEVDRAVFGTLAAAIAWCRSIDEEDLADNDDQHDRVRYVIRDNPKIISYYTKKAQKVYSTWCERAQNGWWYDRREFFAPPGAKKRSVKPLTHLTRSVMMKG